MTYLGIDIGGTGARLRFVCEPNESGHQPTVDEKLSWSHEAEADQDFAELIAAVERVTRGTPERVGALGVARPASVGPDGIITAWPSRPTWVGHSLSALLEQICPGVPSTHEDDGNAAVLAEASATGESNLVYLGLGTGLAGGIVVDGKLIRGANGGAGEIGHLPLAGSPFNSPCSCGRKSCLQVTVSGTAISERVNRRTNGRYTVTDLPEAIRAYEPWALQERATVAVALAAAVSALVEIVAPEQIRFGGGNFARFPGLCEQVSSRLEIRSGRIRPTVAPAWHKACSSLAGAVILARDHYTTLKDPAKVFLSPFS